MADSEFKFLAEDIRKQVEGKLQSAGLLCRVFSRGKSEQSLNKKLQEGGYSLDGKLLQDSVGVRVVLYFQEDTYIVDSILKSHFEIIPHSSSIDQPTKDKFTVSRYNLVFKLPPPLNEEASRVINNRPIEPAFEVQIRSVFSEGWHEVEHDLRYKCKDSWEGHDDLSRTLNGIMATLETSEWSMKSLFEDLAYRHYKDRRWVPMLTNRLRIRSAPEISAGLINHFDSDSEFSKNMYRIDRKFIITVFSENRIIAPTFDNAIYVWNLKNEFNQEIIDATPLVIKNSFEEWALRNK